MIVDQRAKIIQVQSATKTDVFSASVPSAGVSGDAISASITPIYSNSKILVIASLSLSSDGTSSVYGELQRDGSPIAIGDVAGSRARRTFNTNGGSISTIANGTGSLNHLDSPATTSPVTYSVRLGHSGGGTSTVYLNRSQDDTDSNFYARTVSSITLMEVIA